MQLGCCIGMEGSRVRTWLSKHLKEQTFQPASVVCWAGTGTCVGRQRAAGYTAAAEFLKFQYRPKVLGPGFPRKKLFGLKIPLPHTSHDH